MVFLMVELLIRKRYTSGSSLDYNWLSSIVNDRLCKRSFLLSTGEAFSSMDPLHRRLLPSKRALLNRETSNQSFSLKKRTSRGS